MPYKALRLVSYETSVFSDDKDFLTPGHFHKYGTVLKRLVWN